MSRNAAQDFARRAFAMVAANDDHADDFADWEDEFWKSV